jgi:excisionase family DNA binding protein
MERISRFTQIRDLPDPMRVPEAAAKLDVSTGCVYQMIRSNQLAAIRLGRLLRIPREALEALLTSTEAQ